MPAIDSLLKRFGFVRLSRYGMVLTPEGRIITLRPEILDDGMGGRVVGWLDHDLAGAELARWQAPYVKPAPQKAVASRVAILPPRIPALPAALPVVHIPPVATAPVAVVAPDAEPEEDEWEWTIALARARAVAEEVEVAVAALMAPRPSAPPRRTRQDTVPPPPGFRESQPKFIAAKTLPMGVRPPIEPIETTEWPKTEPLTEIDYNDYTNPTTEVVRAVPRPPQRAEHARTTAKSLPVPVVVQPPSASAPHLPRAKSPETIIPVPRLPRVTNAHVIQPVVSPPRRFAKATPQPGYPTADGEVTSTGIAAAPPKTVEMPAPIRPAESDQTSPANIIALPRIPSIKRTAAR